MSNRSLIELNHDYCPGGHDEIVNWGNSMVQYMRSGNPKELPRGVDWVQMRHHSQPSFVTEQCICAAIRMPDGEIILGHRHDACYNVVRNRPIHSADPALVESRRLAICAAEQGFVTSRNRFVGREEAMRIQKRGGFKSAQWEDGVLRGDALFSEDLY